MSQSPYNQPGGPPTGRAFPQPTPTGYEAWDTAPANQRISIAAIFSLVLALLCVTAPLAIPLGALAIVFIGSSRGRLYGRGLAIAGIIIGLFISSLAVFGLIAANNLGKDAAAKLWVPTGAAIKLVETKDAGKLAPIMSPAVRDSVTPDRVAAFADKLSAARGKFVSSPDNLWSIVSSYFSVGQQFQVIQPDMPQGAAAHTRPMVPVSLMFDNGWTLMMIEVTPDDIDPAQKNSPGPLNPGGQFAGAITNLGFVSGSSVVWMLDRPGTAAVGGGNPGASASGGASLPNTRSKGEPSGSKHDDADKDPKSGG